MENYSPFYFYKGYQSLKTTAVRTTENIEKYKTNSDITEDNYIGKNEIN